MGPTPVHFVLAIFPGFQLLDLAGPLDILNQLSEIEPPSDAADLRLSLTIVAESLDPVPAKPLPPASADWIFDLQQSTKRTGVNAAFNEYLHPDLTFADYLAAVETGTKKVDVLLIPGGIGTRLTRIHRDGSETPNVQSLCDFLTEVAPRISTAIITVCTGSDVLAQSGLLEGRRATTNMARFDFVARRNPGVQWQYGARWVRSLPSEVPARNGVPIEVWSSAGISAGMDVTLAFVTHFYGGADVARGLAKALEYDWREIAEGEKDPWYEKFYSV